ncbi:CBS domain-containing protein [Actinomadura fibrosa]|uniref:CBS domain-containing protein n=1 Tax=Actinomadura fibrosa TaxID=111802 RepID=A0ABW2XJQ4_9ACTN|nr:CBS domain-containing protein [Actinomadura fibrosa]
MLVREAMTSPVVTIPPSATVRQALRVLHEHDLAALPVVDGGGRLLGIVTEMDLLRAEIDADPRAFARPVASRTSGAAPGRDPDPAPPPRRVEQVMTRDVETTRPGAEVADLAETMMKTRAGWVPVLDGARVVGIVGRRDLVAVLAGGDARIRDDVLTAIAEYGPAGPGWDASEWDVSVDGGVVELRPGPGRHDDAAARRIADLLARTVPGVTRVSFRGTVADP